MEDLKLRGVNTRSTKDKFYRIKTKMDQLINKLNTDNEIMSTAVFMINTKMASDQKYKDDQAAFRNWIDRAEDALADLIDKLEESGMNIASDHAQAPVASDLSSILQHMDKRWADMTKKLTDTQSDMRTKWAESQTQLSNKLAESQTKMSENMAEALKTSSKPKFKRIQPTFLPKKDMDDYSLYRVFKRDFAHFIQDVDEANWEDKARWLLECVKGDAYQLIKEITLNEAGYTKAFADLDSQYLCSNKVKDSIFEYIRTFSIANTGKNHSTLKAKLTTLSNYIK